MQPLGLSEESKGRAAHKMILSCSGKKVSLIKLSHCVWKWMFGCTQWFSFPPTCLEWGWTPELSSGNADLWVRVPSAALLSKSDQGEIWPLALVRIECLPLTSVQHWLCLMPVPPKRERVNFLSCPCYPGQPASTRLTLAAKSALFLQTGKKDKIKTFPINWNREILSSSNI